MKNSELLLFKWNKLRFSLRDYKGYAVDTCLFGAYPNLINFHFMTVKGLKKGTLVPTQEHTLSKYITATGASTAELPLK